MQDKRHQPGQQNRVHIKVRQDHRQVIGQAAGFQNRVECAAGADNQQDVGDGPKAVFGMSQQNAHPHLPTDAEHVIGDKDGDKHRGDGVADKFQHCIQRAAFRHIQFSDGFHQHQANR